MDKREAEQQLIKIGEQRVERMNYRSEYLYYHYEKYLHNKS